MTTLTWPEVDILHGLLDNTLEFTWTDDGRQFLLFSLRHYFLIDQDHVFASFYRSVHVCVTRTLQIFNYSLSHGGGQIRLLACRLLDYFNKFPREHFDPQSLLFRPCSVPDFLVAAQKQHSLIGKETFFPRQRYLETTIPLSIFFSFHLCVLFSCFTRMLLVHM